MSAQQPYQLAFTLQGHAGDVRSLNAPSPEVPLLLSSSRDGSAIVWGPSRDGMWEVKMRIEGPERRYVSCVGLTRHSGQAYLLAGSMTGVLSTYILPSMMDSTPDSTPEPQHVLVEHKQNICCMDVSKGGLIATGSWDNTARVWKNFKSKITIELKMAVWGVKLIGEDKLLTAGADNKIILHSIDLKSGRSTVLQEYTGHSQPVRGLSLSPDGQGFWSCGNDSVVNRYTFDKPEPVQSLSGHTSFVYNVTALPDGSGAISTGEDGTLRVWSNSSLVQTIPHPCNSIWASAAVPAANGSTYIASAAQDTAIRLFTRDPTLMAPPTERERWDQQVSERQLDKSQVGDVKHSDLPGMEALGREGKKDGQVIMIKNNGQVEAYSWTSSTKTWQQIGQVVDAIGQGRKQLYEGKEYDYVFDVDVSEGMPPLKLPYNVSENPWVAAQKFLERNELPSTYTEQVVGFIEKNTNGATLGAGDAQAYIDPYTGGSRYTGASSSAGPSMGGGDPFTGGSAYSSTPAAPARSNSVLPVKTYLSFKTINVDAVKRKIGQLNDEMKSSNNGAAFTGDDDKNMFEVYNLAARSPSALPNVNSKSAGEKYDSTAFTSLVQRWPEAQRFPLIDLARYLAAISPALGTPETLKAFFAACEWDSPWQASKPRETNTLLALRGIANLFLTANGRDVLAKNAGDVLAKLKQRKWEELGARKVPFITIALNYSAMAANGLLPAGQATTLLELIVFVLENEAQDGETLYRAAVALGNLLVSPSTSGSLQVGAVQSARALIVERAGSLDEKRLKELAAEIGGL